MEKGILPPSSLHYFLNMVPNEQSFSQPLLAVIMLVSYLQQFFFLLPPVSYVASHRALSFYFLFFLFLSLSFLNILSPSSFSPFPTPRLCTRTGIIPPFRVWSSNRVISRGIDGTTDSRIGIQSSRGSVEKSRGREAALPGGNRRQTNGSHSQRTDSGRTIGS